MNPGVETGDETTPLARLARRFAALSGPFDPDAALTALGVTPSETIDAAVELASVCDTSDAKQWLMRNAARRKELESLAADGALLSAVAWRRRLTRDEPTTDLLDALSAQGVYQYTTIEGLLKNSLDREQLARMAVALDRAGGHAPAHDVLSFVRSALDRTDDRARSQAIRQHATERRTHDLRVADEWLREDPGEPPLPVLQVSGPAGSGKSAFLEEVAQRAGGMQPPWIVVRLDFDRPGLDVQDGIGLLMEIARQVGREIGDGAVALRFARLSAAGSDAPAGPAVKGSGRDRVPDDLATQLITSVSESGRPVLVMLDTVERLRSRGQTHPTRLLETVDELCRRGLGPISVIAAGRADALDGTVGRVRRRIVLPSPGGVAKQHLAPAPAESRPAGSRTADAMADLEAALSRNDIREAEYIRARRFGSSEGASASSPVLRVLSWRAGRWADALRDFDPSPAALKTCSRAHAATVVVGYLEMWAETRFSDLARALRGDEHLAEIALEHCAPAAQQRLTGGALDFAVLHADIRPRTSVGSTATGLAEAAATVWSPYTTWSAGAPPQDVVDALATYVAVLQPSWDRMGLTTPDLSTPAGAARVLAASTPYAAVMGSLLTPDDQPLRGVVDHLGRTRRSLAAPTGTAGAGPAPVRSTARALEDLTVRGRFAEWATAAAFATRQPDLHVIARSADRWRRTTAGDWAYSAGTTVPEKWGRRPDASLHERLVTLQTAEQCWAEIAIWSGAEAVHGAAAVLERLRARYPAADRDARGRDAGIAAAVLVGHGFPAAYVPAVARLLSLDTSRPDRPPPDR